MTLNILHIAPSYVPAWRYGGPIWSVHGLARAQAALGHRVDVLTTAMDGPGNLDVPLGEAVLIDGVRVHYFAPGEVVRPIARRLFYAPAMARALAGHVRAADIVHTHSAFLWPTTAASRAARRLGVPYVLSPRGMLWPEMIQSRSAIAKRLWLAAFERRNVEAAAAVHVTAQIEEVKLRELGLRPSRIIDLPNGVEEPGAASTDALSTDVRAVIARPRGLLSLGRLHPKKNNEALIDAMVDCPDAQLVIAGNDESNYARDLALRARDRGVGDRVQILARQIAGADKEALFAHAAIFVLPSHSENFGNTVLEAMIRGVPVIVSEAAGVAEVVKAAGAGLTVGPEALALSQAIGHLLSHPDDSRLMAERGRAYAHAHFGWMGIAEKMIDAYRGLIR